MSDWQTITLFIAAAMILVVTPGPCTLYLVSRTLQQGIAAGIASSMGVQVGTLIHVTAAALGISALLLSSTLAFNVVKYLGAVYLVFLGVKTLLARENVSTVPTPVAGNRLISVFFQGIMVNVLNPKTTLFFTAFLPQFVDVRRGNVVSQITFLGAVLAVVGSCSDITYVLVTGKLGRRLRPGLRLPGAGRYISGSVYIGLGVAAALTGTVRK